MSELTKKQFEFLQGLVELTKKTGIEIGGCGCCDSPHLYDAKLKDCDLNKAGYCVRTDSITDGWVGDVSWVGFSEKQMEWFNEENKTIVS